MITGYSRTVVKLPDRTEVALADLLGPLPEELRPLYKKLKSRMDKLNVNNVKGYFEIGQLIRDEIDHVKAELERNGRSEYGTHLFKHLGVELDVEDRILRDCHRVAERFSNEEYQALVIANGLSWGHARILAVVTDTGRRKQLVARIIEEKLSADDLMSLIRHEQPRRPRGPGRSPAVPRGLPQAVDRLRRGSKTFQNVLGVLFGTEFDIPTVIQRTPPDLLTPEIREAMDEGIERLAAIAHTVEETIGPLKASLPYIDACIAAKAQQEKEAQAEEDDPLDRPRSRRAPVRS